MSKNERYKDALKHPIFEYISKASSNLQLETYVIGGFVRDYFLKRGTPKDIDIVAVGSGIDLANEVSKLLPNKPKVQIFKTYGTAMLRFDDMEIEFVGARKESYQESSRKPMVENGTIEIDGQDVNAVQQGSLRSAIGVVSQDTSLLHRTIRENILYGKADATEEELIAAAIKAINANFKDGKDGYQVEIKQFGKCFGTDDFHEGTTAFLEKRKAEFPGN